MSNAYARSSFYYGHRQLSTTRRPRRGRLTSNNCRDHGAGCKSCCYAVDDRGLRFRVACNALWLPAPVAFNR